MKLFLLFLMLFMHIVDDYYLQGWLASSKQKSWWEQNAPNKLYKYDYLMALFMHSLSWAFMIMLPYHIYILIFSGTFYPILLIINLIIHMFVDNMKANLKKINLIQDQLIHMIQIIITWYMLFFVY